MVLVSDFVGYWSHRWRHSSKLLWTFHSIHHSQTNLTIVSNYRFHVVDETLLRLWLFIPFQMLGTGLALWLWLDLIMAWILYVQHSEWKWTYGRLGYIFVSPAFPSQASLHGRAAAEQQLFNAVHVLGRSFRHRRPQVADP